MNIAIGLAIATAFFVLLLFLVFIQGKIIAKKNENTGRSVAKYGGIAITAIYCCMLFWLGSIYGLAWMHGNRDPWLDIASMEKCTMNTPIESKLPVDLSGCIIVVYRYDCSSCHDIYHDLANALRNERNVYYVCSRSEQGLKLRESYDIPEVPYGIYIPKDENETLTRVSLSKMTGDSEGKHAVLDEYKLDILLRGAHGLSITAVPDSELDE